MGAWIETKATAYYHYKHKSHPTWVRGLKLIYHYEENTENNVAPYVGAWIETRHVPLNVQPLSVAPYVGAWIETVTGQRTATSS